MKINKTMNQLHKFTHIFKDHKPVSSPRPRASKHGHSYMPTKYKEAKKQIRNEFGTVFNLETDLSLDDIEIECMNIMFSFKIPKSRRKELLVFAPHKQTPDIDNLYKTYSDAICSQDSTIHKICCFKEWRDHNSVGINIEYTIRPAT